MAIKTLDQLIEGMQSPRHFFKYGIGDTAAPRHSAWLWSGSPAAAALPSAGINGEALVSPVAGELPLPAAPNGKNAYVAAFGAGIDNASSSYGFSLVLVDRLWQNSGLSVTNLAEQALSSVQWPVRCPSSSGFEPDTLGEQILVAVETTVKTTNTGAVNMTLRYTNQSGVPDRVSTLTGALPATAEVGAMAVFPLVGGDIGVRSVQGFQLGSSLVAGAISLVAFRPIARVPMLWGATLDWAALGLPKMFAGTVPNLHFIGAGVGNTFLSGYLATANG